MLQREAADHRAHYVCCKMVGSPAESGLEAGRPFGGSHPAGLQPGVRSLGPKQTGTGVYCVGPGAWGWAAVATCLIGEVNNELTCSNWE